MWKSGKLYSFASRDPVVLSDTLTDKYNIITNYMESHRLAINAEKTHLVVIGKRKMDNARKEVQLLAGTHVIRPSVTQKLLGCHIHQSLKWKEHMTNDKSLFRQLASRLNALRKLAVNKTSGSQCSVHLRPDIPYTPVGWQRELFIEGSSGGPK